MFLRLESPEEYDELMHQTYLNVVESTNVFRRICKKRLNVALEKLYFTHAQMALENGEVFDGGISEEVYTEHRVEQSDVFEHVLNEFLFEVVIIYFSWMVDQNVDPDEYARFFIRHSSLMITSHVRTVVETMIGVRNDGEMHCVLHSDVFQDGEMRERLLESIDNLFKYHFTEVRRLVFANSFRMFGGVRIPRQTYEDMQLAVCLAAHAKRGMWMKAMSPELWMLVWKFAAYC